MTVRTDRQQVARQKINKAVQHRHPVIALSDVFYDGAHDRTTQVDEEGDKFIEEFGYDCDDLAAVLLPLIVREVSL